MSEMEKVIGPLKWIADYFEECRQNASFGSKAEELFYEMRSAANDAIKLLKEQEAPTGGQWISVKDRMPEDGVFVLIVNDDSKMMIAKYESEVVRWEYKYTNYDWDVWDDKEQGPVCYWMPLPEPPEQEEED